MTTMQCDIESVQKELSAKDEELTSHNYRQECLLNDV